MLNNLTNFFNLITSRKIKSVPSDTDLIPLGTRDRRYSGNYQPTGIEYTDLKADILTGITCLPKFDFKVDSIGEKVSFSKLAGSDPITNKDIIIPGLLEITRDNDAGGGIYNIAQESVYNNNQSPLNTSWNTQYITDTDTSWANLWDIENRSYDTWRKGARTPEGNYAAPQYVGMPAVMKYDDGNIVKYYLIIFTTWGVGQYDEGGAFAYDRYELIPSVEFTKNNYIGTAVDIISEGVHIKRGLNGPIYNSVNEPESQQGVSPRNTKWNSNYTDTRSGYSGFADLSNLESRVYTDFTAALDGAIGNNVLNTDLIMHDLTTDLYYKFVFTSWTNNNAGGGFQYTRTVIPQSCGIKFADGTVMNTAATGSSAPSGVQSVTGLNTNNADPLNPVVQISVNGSTVTGNGTPGSPLTAPYQSPSVDGVTITGTGTPGNPLVASGVPSFIEYNNTDKTLWNNGKGNIATNLSYGEGALINNTTGLNNTAIGNQALRANTTGGENVAIGNSSLYNAEAFANVAIGSLSMYTNTTGQSNTSVGFYSLYSNTTGGNNTAIGREALYNNTIATNSVSVGGYSLHENVNGGRNNALGVYAAYSNVSGTDNVALGYNALRNNTTAHFNISIGNLSLNNNTTGTRNIAIGTSTLYNNTTGSDNTAIGDSVASGNFSGSVILGRLATATANNQFVVGSVGTNAGSVTTEVNASSQVWNVVINGVARKILLA